MNRKIKICQFTPSLYSGGTEERIARIFGGLDAARFDKSWIGFGPVREALVDHAGPGVAIRPIPRNPAGGFEPSVIARLTHIFRQLTPDVVHIHNWSTSLYGILAARAAGIPHVAFGVGGHETREPSPLKRRIAMRAIAPLVDRFTAVCHYLKDEIAADFGVPDRAVAVLPTGVDVARIEASSANRSRARAELGLPDHALVVGTISVLRPVKRIGDLIQAGAKLKERFPQIHLLIAGNPQRTRIEDMAMQADALGLGGRVLFPGRLEDPAAMLGAFDVFVNCSDFEGSSNAILEAMAAAHPIVASNVGGTPELVRHLDTGLLVEPRDVDGLADAIGRLLENPGERTELGNNGRRFVRERHTYDEMIAQHQALYARLATGSTERAAIQRRTWASIRKLSDGLLTAARPN